jgi:hypothetical protein
MSVCLSLEVCLLEVCLSAELRKYVCHDLSIRLFSRFMFLLAHLFIHLYIWPYVWFSLSDLSLTFWLSMQPSFQFFWSSDSVHVSLSMPSIRGFLLLSFLSECPFESSLFILSRYDTRVWYLRKLFSSSSGCGAEREAHIGTETERVCDQFTHTHERERGKIQMLTIEPVLTKWSFSLITLLLY